MNRIDRVTAILIQLQSRKIVKAQDIASRFGISLRTVYRDIKTLEEAGVPVTGEAGIGYSIMEGYRLPPVMFTREEATAFLTAEKLIEKFTDNSTENSYKSAMYKVRAVLRSTEKELLENIEEHIEVVRKYMPHDGTTATNNVLQTVLKAIAEKKVLHIRYHAFHSHEKTSRDIEPIGIFYSGGFWHTIGFCRLRNDYRDFRTDRIEQLHITDEQIQQLHPTLKNYLEHMAREQDLETVVIKTDTSIADYLQVQKFYYGFVKETQIGACTEMTFLTGKDDYFLRWFMSFADHASIISPHTLIDRYQKLLADILRKRE
jgi:predicted DNA-binding transcriptional regulator YafY